MILKTITGRSYRLASIENAVCKVLIEGGPSPSIDWRISDLNGRIYGQASVELQEENCFYIQLGDIAPGHYILSLRAQGEAPRHLKLLVEN